VLKKIIKLLKDPKVVTLYIIVTFLFVVYYIYIKWEVVPGIVESSHLDYLIYAVVFGILNLISYGFVVFLLYTDLGAGITYWNTLKIILVSRIGVYLPGRIWYASNFYIFSRKFNISPLVIGQSFGLVNIFLFITGGICSLQILLPLLTSWQKIILVSSVFLLLIFSQPSVVNYIVSIFPKISELLKNLIYFTKFTSKIYFKYIIYFIILWLISGVRLFFCTLALTPIQYTDFMTVLASSAASLIIGMLAIFAPGGIGVREGVGAVILSTIIPMETAVFVMIISRFLSAGTDLSTGLSAFYFLKKKIKRHP
jgi:hypothetical protein